MSPPPTPPRGARGLLGAMVKPAPSPPRLAIAIQAGVAMLLTVGVPSAFGHLEIGLLASTGALSALYPSARSRRERLRRLPLVQAGLLLAVVLVAGVPLAGWPAAGWLSLVAITLCGQFLGHSLLNRALRTVGAPVVAVVSLLEVPGAALVAALWLGERLAPATLVGLVVLLGGVALVVRGSRRA